MISGGKARTPDSYAAVRRPGDDEVDLAFALATTSLDPSRVDPAVADELRQGNPATSRERGRSRTG